MDGELVLISDGDGLAVIGDAAAVERFVSARGLESAALPLPKLGSVLRTSSAAAHAGSEASAQSGRWIKLTEESAKLVAEHGLMESKTVGVSHAMIGKPGEVKRWLQVVRGPGSKLTNPALLTGAAGLMAQVAMQETMSEITAYLKAIDAKLDDVLRKQDDTVVAGMLGVGLDIDEAMTLREHTGRVGGVTWSKIQASSATISQTQAYALRQLEALADKLERESKVGRLVDAAGEAEVAARDWLAVLARCFQLQDALAVLELDRVLDEEPDQIDGHRSGLRAARQDRIRTITEATAALTARMNAAAVRANSKVLFHPAKSPRVVTSAERLADRVVEFDKLLGHEFDRPSFDKRRWTTAAGDARLHALQAGGNGVGAVARAASRTIALARPGRRDQTAETSNPDESDGLESASSD